MLWPKNSAWTNQQQTNEYLESVRNRVLQQEKTSSPREPDNRVADLLDMADEALTYDDPEQAQEYIRETRHHFGD